MFKCVNHEISSTVKSLEDFQKVPEGGCKELCKIRLDCGHSCKSLCHPFDKTDEDPSGHKDKKCQEACSRFKQCLHLCPFKCH
jgi:hypothetical protein